MAFWLIAAQNNLLSCARWFGVAFAFGAIAVLFQEFSVGADTWSMGRVIYGFLAVSASISAISGLLTYYKKSVNWKLIAGFLTFVLLANWFVQAVFTNVLLTRIVTHVPNVFVHLFAAYVVFSYGPRKTLEWILSVSAFLSSLFFLSNPVFVLILNSASEANKTELLGLFDWAWGASGITLGVANGLLIILIFVRDMFARSRIDGLSGLLNRKTFEDEMDSLLSRAKLGKCAGTLIIADLDHFKIINDSYGHAQGDEVIIRFSKLLRNCAVEGVIVGRIGGEEFGVFLPECDSSSGIEFAQAICDAFQGEHFDVPGPPLSQTASFGVAEYFVGEPVSSLFSRADVALYQSKVKGRNRVSVSACPQMYNKNKDMEFMQKDTAAA